jgi:hypothetical protein
VRRRAVRAERGTSSRARLVIPNRLLTSRARRPAPGARTEGRACTDTGMARDAQLSTARARSAPGPDGLGQVATMGAIEMRTRHWNPLDANFDGLRLGTRSDYGALVPIERLLARLAATGMGSDMLQEGVENWISLGVMRQRADGAVGWTEEGRSYRERSRSPRVTRGGRAPQQQPRALSSAAAGRCAGQTCGAPLPLRWPWHGAAGVG